MSQIDFVERPNAGFLDKLREFNQQIEGVEILKTTEAYGYYYATLADIEKIIKPILRKCEIWYRHEGGYEKSLGQNYLYTEVYSVKDPKQFISMKTLIDKEAKVGGMNRFMIEGAAITYFRRYHITTLLGLTTDEDTDAGGKRVVKNDKTKQSGRSIEAASKSRPNFIEIFTNLCETKTKDQVDKTFNSYKGQLNNEEIKEIEKIIKNKYAK